MIRILLVAPLLIAMCAGEQSDTAGKRYSNEEYGFSVELPARAPICRSGPPEHDGGVSIFLDSGPDGCNDLLSRPFIGIYASYNAMLASDAEDVLRMRAESTEGERHDAPKALGVAGLPAASGRWDRADGWIVIRVVAQGGDWPDGGKTAHENVPYINYTVMLRTTRERLEHDLERFRSILRDVQITTRHPH
jgi:hypothetical protein